MEIVREAVLRANLIRVVESVRESMAVGVERWVEGEAKVVWSEVGVVRGCLSFFGFAQNRFDNCGISEISLVARASGFKS